MKVGDRVYGKPGVFFPTHEGRGMVLKIENYGYHGGSGDNIEIVVVQTENGEEHTVPVSSLQIESAAPDPPTIADILEIMGDK